MGRIALPPNSKRSLIARITLSPRYFDFFLRKKPKLLCFFTPSPFVVGFPAPFAGRTPFALASSRTRSGSECTLGVFLVRSGGVTTFFALWAGLGDFLGEAIAGALT